jgi:hypothetical protein
MAGRGRRQRGCIHPPRVLIRYLRFSICTPGRTAWDPMAMLDAPARTLVDRAGVAVLAVE